MGGPLEKNEQPQGPGTTSLSLLDRIKTNDPAGWVRVTRLYGPLVYRWCRRQKLQETDAADIAQEVFRTVAVRIRDFRRQGQGDSFRGWLWTITRYKIGDFLRRLERQPAAAGGSDAYQHMLALPAELPDDAETASESCSLVHRALQLIRAEFEERTWTAFLRVAIDNHAPKDVAADLGVTPDAVRMAKSRILRRLREELLEAEL